MSATPSPSNPDAKSNRTINPPEIVIVKKTVSAHALKRTLANKTIKRHSAQKSFFYAKQLKLRLNPEA